LVAIGVKLATTPTDEDSRHLRLLRHQCGDAVELVVVTTGRHAYRRPDGIAVFPAVLLGP